MTENVHISRRKLENTPEGEINDVNFSQIVSCAVGQFRARVDRDEALSVDDTHISWKIELSK